MLDTVKVYLAGQGNNSYTRQGAQERQRREAEQGILRRIGPLRRKCFRKLLASAQECAVEREDAIANIGLPFPQLRRLLAELGQRLAAGGAIAQPENIYWLEAREADALAAALEANEPLICHAASVEARKAGWKPPARQRPQPFCRKTTCWPKCMRPRNPKSTC